MNFTFPLLLAMLPIASAATAQADTPTGIPAAAIPKTTGVLVILTARQGVTPQQIIAVLPSEVRATVKLYLDGKIREWYSRGDGKGAVFLLDVKSEDEAHALMETLPLAQQHLMDHQYIPLGPLMPLRMLIAPTADQQQCSPAQ